VINIPGLADFNDSWLLHEIEFNDNEQQVDLRMGDDRLRFESECSIGDNGSANQDLENVLVDGTWQVVSYMDDGQNETDDFDGYQFKFNGDGSITVTNGSTVEGTWSVQNAGTELVMDFGTAIPLDELNDEWDVVSFTASRIELEDVSGGGGGTDTLVFEKQ
jgi:hypothetical protein